MVYWLLLRLRRVRLALVRVLRQAERLAAWVSLARPSLVLLPLQTRLALQRPVCPVHSLPLLRLRREQRKLVASLASSAAWTLRRCFSMALSLR